MTQKIYDLVGLGNALLDRIAAVDDDFLTRHNISKGHMMLVDAGSMTALQKEAMAEKESSGGMLSNSLAGAAQMGSKAVFIGRVGADAQGKTFIADLEAQKVIFAGQRVEGPTGVCFVFVTPDSQRSMWTSLGVSAALSREDVDERFIAQAKILYLEAYLWDSPTAREAAAAALTHARAHGVLTALNLSDPLCVDRHRSDLAKVIASEIDILIGNEKEICAFHQTADFAAAEAACLAMNIPIAALTRSHEGSVVIENNKAHHIPALRVEKVLDSTGAGDLYAAGFLHALARGQTAIEGGQIGARLAAAIIQIYGARLELDFSL